MAREPVDRAVQHAVALLDDRPASAPPRTRFAPRVGHAAARLELVEDSLADTDRAFAANRARGAGTACGRARTAPRRRAARRSGPSRPAPRVARRIRRGPAFAVDGVELFLRILRRTRSCDAAGDRSARASRDTARHRSTRARSGAAAGTARSCAALEQALVRAHGVHVRDDGVGFDRAAVGEPHAARRTARLEDALDRRASRRSRRRARERASSAPQATRACRRADTRRRPRSACARCRTAPRATHTGDEPTYCVKWSSIWATRSSGTARRMVPATLWPMRSAARSASVDALNVVPRSSVSRSPPTDFQKKNCSEIR